MKPHSKRFVKYAVASVALLNLVACAVPPKFISNYHNANDPCQMYAKPEGYAKPNWCGASRGQVVNVQQGLSRNNYIITVK